MSAELPGRPAISRPDQVSAGSPRSLAAETLVTSAYYLSYSLKINDNDNYVRSNHARYDEEVAGLLWGSPRVGGGS